MIETQIMLGYRGRQVLALIRAASENGERPPSYAMIATQLGMGSVADVCNVVRRLEKRGLLKRCDTGSRYRRGWHHPVVELA
jgi:DNA-binding Lrp family transcriptional regulator